MPAPFDALAATAAPDSFDAATRLIRTAPPPRPRRGRLGMAGLALAALVGAGAVPVRVAEPLGVELRWRVAGQPGADHESVRLLAPLATAWPTGPFEAVEDSVGTTYRIAVAMADRSALRSWHRAVAALPDVREAALVPISQTVRRPLLAAAARRLGVPLAVDARHVAADALAEALTAQLQGAGLGGLTARVTDRDGTREIALATERQGTLLRFRATPGLTLRIEAGSRSGVGRIRLDHPTGTAGPGLPGFDPARAMRPADAIRQLRASGRDSAAALLEAAFAGLDTAHVRVITSPR